MILVAFLLAGTALLGIVAGLGLIAWGAIAWWPSVVVVILLVWWITAPLFKPTRRTLGVSQKTVVLPRRVHIPHRTRYSPSSLDDPGWLD